MECLICGSNNPTLIESSRIQSLCEASHQRGDGLWEKLAGGVTQFSCHKNCISTYCSKHHIERYLKKRKLLTDNTTSTKKLRGSHAFNFLQDCFFCGQTCSVERPLKNPSRWREAYVCRTADVGKTTSKEAILRHANERNDTWARDVTFRVNSAISDLHAADARYHKDCLAKFFTNSPSECPANVCDCALDTMVTIMLSDKERIWNSVELHTLYNELGGTQHSRRSLLKTVSLKLHPDILVLSSPGIASILVFRGKASHQLRIIDDAEDECHARAITSLAQRIKAECPKPSANSYATRISMGNVIGDCSETLLSLLAAISPKLDATMQAAMIGNIVTCAVTNQATCLQLSLGIMLNQQRKLVEQFHNFGVTSSYNELRRFKISAASSMANSPRGLGLFDSTNGLIQIVADNFDTQISSQNGQKSTHGLAMIITQSGKPKPEHVHGIPDEVPTIKRLKWEETTASCLTLGEVNIQRYHGIKKPQMPEKYGFKVVPTLAFLASMHISMNRAAVEDMTFLRQVTVDRSCPEYSGFNTKRARESGQQPGPKTDIVYTPLLDMIPAEPDTMKTAMVEAQRLTSLTGQEWTIFTNDQQLYQVAVNITWVDQNMFSQFVPRLGGMHMLMSFVGAVGVLMAGSGLEDILKSTFAGVPKLLSGKKFPQNVRALRLVTEELLRPILVNQELHTMMELTESLEATSKQSNTSKLWVDCLIKPVLIMMAFVRAEREGDWPLHLFAVEKMLPYFFASSHINYARYGLYYLRSMQRLHPTPLKKFMSGEHVMRHQNGLWNAIWSDLFIESTYMRYGHGLSGIIGSTLNESTLAIWALSHSTCAQLMNDLEAMKDGEAHRVVISHKEEQQTRVKADAADRMSIREAVSSCIDVFDNDKHPATGLVDIFSGRVVDDPALNVHCSLQIGTTQWLEYEAQWPSGFNNKLQKKVKTIAAVTKKTTKLGNSQHLVDTEFIYARVIGIMASSRETVSVETLFSHELAPHPTALFDDSGEMRKTTKSVLKTKLQVQCGIRNRQPPVVVILDGCAILWTIPWPASPAKVLAFINAVVATIMRRIEASSVLHVVFDRYYKLSTKSWCRTARQKGLSRVFKLTEESPLPKQAMVLNVSANKEQVIQMIVKRLCSIHVPQGKRVVITGPDPHPIEVGVGAQETAITHEEADVTMVYHMIQEASAGISPIRIVSDDTDVLLILAHHLYARTNDLPNTVDVTMEACSGSHGVIDVNEVVKKHVAIIPNLLGAHALSGCDTVSSFVGIGKTTVLKKLEIFSDLLCLGDLSASPDEVTSSCLKYVAMLYGQEPGVELNNMRAAIFKRKLAGKRHVPPKLSSLPPTIGAFRSHCQRAHYQTALWKAAGMPSPPDLDPLQYGWEMSGAELRPEYTPTGQLAAPDEVLNLVSCGCKTGCKTALCSCTKFMLPCTEFCKCMGQASCQNPMRMMTADNIDESETEPI